MRPKSSSDGAEQRKLASNDNLDSLPVKTKIRVVVGLFDHPANLLKAIDALIAKGFTTSELCVSGSVDTIAMAESMLHQSRQNNDSSLRALFLVTQVYDVIGHSPTIIASKSEVFKQLNNVKNKQTQSGPRGSCNDCFNVFSELIAHIKVGRLVLIVDVGEPRRLIHASKTLLRFDPSVMQTHEFV